MSVISYPNAQSTLTLNNYTFSDLAEGEALNLSPVNERTSRTNSMNSGVSVSTRIDGGVHNLTIVVQKHSDDDKELNGWRKASAPTILDGSLKRAYTQDGTSKRATVKLDSGSFTTQPSGVDNNQDADNTKTYVIQFRNAEETF